MSFILPKCLSDCLRDDYITVFKYVPEQKANLNTRTAATKTKTV